MAGCSSGAASQPQSCLWYQTEVCLQHLARVLQFLTEENERLVKNGTNWTLPFLEEWRRFIPYLKNTFTSYLSPLLWSSLSHHPHQHKVIHSYNSHGKYRLSYSQTFASEATFPWLQTSCGLRHCENNETTQLSLTINFCMSYYFRNLGITGDEQHHLFLFR